MNELKTYVDKIVHFTESERNIFVSLFSYFGLNNGASLFNIFFLILVSKNLCGFLPYVLSGKRHTLEEASHFDEAEVEA